MKQSDKVNSQHSKYHLDTDSPYIGSYFTGGRPMQQSNPYSHRIHTEQYSYIHNSVQNRKVLVQKTSLYFDLTPQRLPKLNAYQYYLERIQRKNSKCQKDTQNKLLKMRIGCRGQQIPLKDQFQKARSVNSKQESRMTHRKITQPCPKVENVNSFGSLLPWETDSQQQFIYL